MQLSLNLPSAESTDSLGQFLAQQLRCGVIYLSGSLGAGKTSLVRAYLRARGVTGAIRSPTYTLIESYPLASGMVFHLDLYRLADPEEVDYLGIRELAEPVSAIWIEWAERAIAELPVADLSIRLGVVGDGREAVFFAHSDAAKRLLTALKEDFA